MTKVCSVHSQLITRSGDFISKYGYIGSEYSSDLGGLIPGISGQTVRFSIQMAHLTKSGGIFIPN